LPFRGLSTLLFTCLLAQPRSGRLRPGPREVLNHPQERRPASRCGRSVTSVILPEDSTAGYVFLSGFGGVCGGMRSRTIGKPIHASGSPVRVKPLLVVLWFSLTVAVAALPADSQPGLTSTFDGKALDTTQLVAWLMGGVSSSRLARLVAERGLATRPTNHELKQLESAGAGKDLMCVLSSGNARSAKVGTPIPASLLRAAAEARQQRFPEAEADLRVAASSDDQNSALHFVLSVIYRQQEKWDEAFDELEQATRLMPDLAENHGALAYLFYRLDDGPNAIAEARTALSIDPKNSEAYQYLGLGLYSNGQYKAAVHAYAESLARDPDNADTYYDMGIAWHADGNLTGAITAYAQAIHLRPAFWEAHSNLGLILHEEGNLNQAVAEYREAKRLAPGEASIRNNLGNTYCDQGNYDSAIEELQALYGQHPEWQQGHACLASAYMAKKDYDAAVEELRLALRQNPTGPAEHRILGQALMLDNKLDEALRELRLAVTFDPDSAFSHHLLGTVLFQQQQMQAAEKEFREAVRLKNSADNHFSLAACLMSMDRNGEALSELEMASRLDPERTLYRARREELLKLMKETSSR
jgi:tetratricopeptide (TPR) repeat protein